VAGCKPLPIDGWGMCARVPRYVQPS
jgi:hypothetical protein